MTLLSRHAILIEKPAAEIFRALLDLEASAACFPGVREVRALDDLAAGSPGKRYQEHSQWPWRGEQQIALEIAECHPEQKLALHADRLPVRLRYDYDLRDAGGGRTQLQWSCRVRPGESGQRWALPLLRRVLDARGAQGLETLRQRLEIGAESMCAEVVTRFGGADQVMQHVEDAALPEMGPDDVLVRVQASSVNPIDCARRSGYGRNLFRTQGAAFPLILGRDVSGRVEAVGSRVRRFRVGEEVWGAVDPFRSGAWAEFTVLSARELAIKPASLSHEEAAALPYVALTTWAALVGRAGLGPEQLRGRQVLVHAGAGGVGSFAIQLLRVWGARVTATCSGGNFDLVRSLGAERAIDYRTQRFEDELRDYDLVFDTLGGAAEAPSLAVLKRGGGAHYVSIVHPFIALTDRYGRVAGAAAAALQLGWRKLVQRLAHGRSYDWAVFRPDGRALSEIGRWIDEGSIRPVIDRSYPLDELPAAQARVETRHARGKVVLRVPADEPAGPGSEGG